MLKANVISNSFDQVNPTHEFSMLLLLIILFLDTFFRERYLIPNPNLVLVELVGHYDAKKKKLWKIMTPKIVTSQMEMA